MNRGSTTRAPHLNTRPSTHPILLLQDCKWVTLDSIRVIAEHCLSLFHLSVTGCPHLSQEHLQTLPAALLSRVEVLGAALTQP